MKDYEICKRITPLSNSKINSFFRWLKPKKCVAVECFIIRTNKTQKEILKHYGGSCFVEGITECTRTINQDVPILS